MWLGWGAEGGRRHTESLSFGRKSRLFIATIMLGPPSTVAMAKSGAPSPSKSAATPCSIIDVEKSRGASTGAKPPRPSEKNKAAPPSPFAVKISRWPSPLMSAASDQWLSTTVSLAGVAPLVTAVKSPVPSLANILLSSVSPLDQKMSMILSPVRSASRAWYEYAQRSDPEPRMMQFLQLMTSPSAGDEERAVKPREPLPRKIWFAGP